jgi:hypothetical protein
MQSSIKMKIGYILRDGPCFGDLTKRRKKDPRFHVDNKGSYCMSRRRPGVNLGIDGYSVVLSPKKYLLCDDIVCQELTISFRALFY